MFVMGTPILVRWCLNIESALGGSVGNKVLSMASTAMLFERSMICVRSRAHESSSQGHCSGGGRGGGGGQVPLSSIIAPSVFPQYWN